MSAVRTTGRPRLNPGAAARAVQFRVPAGWDHRLTSAAGVSGRSVSALVRDAVYREVIATLGIRVTGIPVLPPGEKWNRTEGECADCANHVHLGTGAATADQGEPGNPPIITCADCTWWRWLHPDGNYDPASTWDDELTDAVLNQLTRAA